MPKDTSFLLAEYTALREEIVKRLEIEHQLATYTVIVFGTILGIGFQNNKITPIILLYPALALFLSIGWSNSDHWGMQVGEYLKECEDKISRAQIEATPQKNRTGWEHYWVTHSHSRYYWAMKGIFISTQALAIVIGIMIVPLNTLLTMVLLSFAITSLLLTLWFLFSTPYRKRKK